MKDKLKYKNLYGSVHFDTEALIFFGKIEEIDDLVTFEGTTVDEIKSSFEEAVDDYLEICELTGREVKKKYKGTFNVRIDPTLHQKAVANSLEQGISLNQFVQKAIEDEIRVLEEV